MSRASIPLVILQVLFLLPTTPVLLVIAWLSLADQRMLVASIIVYSSILWLIGLAMSCADQRVARPGAVSLLLAAALSYAVLRESIAIPRDFEGSAGLLVFMGTIVAVLLGYWAPLWLRPSQ